jgi:hypothetical protein
MFGKLLHTGTYNKITSALKRGLRAINKNVSVAQLDVLQGSTSKQW